MTPKNQGPLNIVGVTQEEFFDDEITFPLAELQLEKNLILLFILIKS